MVWIHRLSNVSDQLIESCSDVDLEPDVKPAGIMCWSTPVSEHRLNQVKTSQRDGMVITEEGGAFLRCSNGSVVYDFLWYLFIGIYC